MEEKLVYGVYHNIKSGLYRVHVDIDTAENLMLYVMLAAMQKDILERVTPSMKVK